MKKFITTMTKLIVVICLIMTTTITPTVTALGLQLSAYQNDNEGLAREYANIAFDSLSIAASACTPIMSDIYKGWYFGIFDNDNARLSKFSSTLHLSKNDVIYGIESMVGFLVFGYEHAYQYFELCARGDDFWKDCVSFVVAAYTKNKTYEQIQLNLDIASLAIKQINEIYPSYEYKQELIDFFTQVSLYYEFILSPTGSFQQLSSKEAQYENDINTSATRLSLVLDSESTQNDAAGNTSWNDLATQLKEITINAGMSCKKTQFGLYITEYLDYSYDEFVVLLEDKEGKHTDEEGNNILVSLRDDLYRTMSRMWNDFIYDDFENHIFRFDLRLNNGLVVMSYINGEVIYDII